MLMEATGEFMVYNNKVSLPFMGELSDISDKSSSTDILERLKLVKSNMDLVVRLAAWHAVETGKPFSQMLRIGISSVVKSAKTFNGHHTEFSDYLKKEISDAMLKSSRL
jgi:DNA-directed RNA polymerase specialized sigma subunit